MTSSRPTRATGPSSSKSVRHLSLDAGHALMQAVWGVACESGVRHDVGEGTMGKGHRKSQRSRSAVMGTRADPRRVERACRAARAHMRADAPWLIAPLDASCLSKREQLTRRTFTVVEVVLCLDVLAIIVSLSFATGGLTSGSLRDLFNGSPSTAIDLVAGCAQPFVAYLLRIAYRHYRVGDAGYALGNLIALACAELLLQSMVGFIALVVLLWRTYHRCSSALIPWARHRRLGGVLVDVSGALVVLVLAAILFYAHMRLAA